MLARAAGMDRRTFVALLGAGLLPRTSAAGAPGTVVVLGAGLAGLAAALALAEAGVDVQVLEARAEPGGRVRTLRAPFADGLHAEAGAALIPTSHRLVRQYAANLGLRLVDVVHPSPGELYVVAGRRIVGGAGQAEPWPLALRPDEQTLGLRGMWRRYVGEALGEVGDPGAPGWPGAALARYDRMTVADFLRSRGASPAAVSLLALGYLALGGDGVETSSALATLRDLALRPEAGMSAVEGGNDRLPAAMAARLGRRVHYGAPVFRIEPRARGVTVLARQHGAVRRWVADRVICALPPALLAAVEFAPALSPARQAALAALRATSLTRVLVQTRTRFWRARGLPLSAVSDSPVKWVWDETATQPGRRGILDAHVAGAAARRLAALPAADRLSEILLHLDRIHPGVREEMETAAVVDWDAERWARGAYAWFRPGQLTSLLPTLLAPEGPVHFAGEHTASASGWMEGALQSGLRAAREVLASPGSRP